MFFYIAGFGTALHFFYFPQLKTAIDSFSTDKKIATRIASVFPNRKDFVRMFHAYRYIRSVFTYVNTSFVPYGTHRYIRSVFTYVNTSFVPYGTHRGFEMSTRFQKRKKRE